MKKRCSRCLRELETTMFHLDKNKEDGFYTICKECRSGKSTIPEVKNGYRACTTCGEIKKDFEFYTSTNAIRRTCKKCSDAKWNKDYSLKQPQMKLFSLMEFVGMTVKAIKLKRVRQREAYKINGVEKQRKFRENRPEYNRVYMNKRRTLLNNNGEYYSELEWERTKNAFGNQCAYCGGKERITLDHFVPVTKGGATVISNVVPACKSCNSKKHNTMPNIFCSKNTYANILIILSELKNE
jgi:5-methylcytosine-specific restriction endonuclease McrA